MADPQTEPSARALGESLAALAVQVAALRGQVAQTNQRLDRAGLHGDLDLAARLEELAQIVADALDAAAPRGPAAPSWLGLDRQAFDAQLAELRRRTDTVLRQHYAGYELRDCWPNHWTAPGILEALIPGRMQGHGGTAEVPRGAARARGEDGVRDPGAGREGAWGAGPGRGPTGQRAAGLVGRGRHRLRPPAPSWRRAAVSARRGKPVRASSDATGPAA